MSIKITIPVGREAAKPVEVDPIEELTRSINIVNMEIGGENVPAISLSTMGGRGTGGLKIPLTEFEAFTATMAEIAEAGVPRAETDEKGKIRVPTQDVLRSEMVEAEHFVTVKGPDGKTPLKDDAGEEVTQSTGFWVNLRAAGGQGNKRNRVRAERLDEVVAFFQMLTPQLPAFQASWSTAMQAYAEAEAKKNAAAAAKQAEIDRKAAIAAAVETARVAALTPAPTVEEIVADLPRVSESGESDESDEPGESDDVIPGFSDESDESDAPTYERIDDDSDDDDEYLDS
tara:strand:+ start:17700 stop:18560 length:861 start_codon:yes stop_codon:yes gene_type:complete